MKPSKGLTKDKLNIKGFIVVTKKRDNLNADGTSNAMFDDWVLPERSLMNLLAKTRHACQTSHESSINNSFCFFKLFQSTDDMSIYRGYL